MMGKTHIAVGLAAAYALTQPKTVPEFVVATVRGSIGGVMADIDVKIDTSNKFAMKASLDALYGEILAVAIATGALVGNIFTRGNILQYIAGNRQMFEGGAVMFLILTVIGKLSDHRDRTHSLLAMALFSISVLLIEPNIGSAFAIGYFSHLVIDLLNKSPIRLLYPLKKDVCLKLCYADGLVNELFLAGAVYLIVLYIFCHSLL